MDLLTMSKKELNRLEVMQRVEEKRMRQKAAAEQLGISERQVKRLLRRYRLQGANGLVSKRRGQPSNNQLAEETREKVLDLLKSKYIGFGPTLACEKLVEVEHLKISNESVRQLMLAEGLWKAKKARKVVAHQMRERRACFGELVQIDGSPHDWFEGRAAECCQLVFIDDATGKLGELLFVESESFFSYCRATEGYLTRYGKPGAFYSDKHGVFRVQSTFGGLFRCPDPVWTGHAGTGYPDHLRQFSPSQRAGGARQPNPPGSPAQRNAFAGYLYLGSWQCFLARIHARVQSPLRSPASKHP